MPSLFENRSKNDDDVMNLDSNSKNDSSLSLLNNSRETALSRAWSPSANNDPWSDNRSPTDQLERRDRNKDREDREDRRDTLSNRKQNDRSAYSRETADSRYDRLDRVNRSSELSESYSSQNRYSGLGTYGIGDRLSESRDYQSQLTAQGEMSWIYKNMRNSMSPMGGQEFTNSVHDSMWNLVSGAYGRSFTTPTESAAGPKIGKDRDPIMGNGAGSFSGFRSSQNPATQAATDPNRPSTATRPNAPAANKTQQPTFLPMPKRPGQPF
jgi:hypothetical protein